MLERITCNVCPRACKLAEEDWGFCDVRQASHGSIRDMYFAAIAWPGVQVQDQEWGEQVPWSFSGMQNKRTAQIYLPGCNLKCEFCIAPYLINLGEVRGIRWVDPSDLVQEMSGSVDVVGFAGGEPSIHPEYLNEVFSKCRAKGMETYLETNGYMTASTAETLAKYTNYVAFGLKASVDPTYYSQKLGVMDTQPIREAVKTFVNKGCNVALTNLTDPSLWDDRDAFNELVKWIHNDLGDETRLVLGSLERGELPPPWTEERIHVTPRGPRVDHLQMYREIAKKTGLRQVFCVFQSPRVGRDLPRLQLATSQGSK